MGAKCSLMHIDINHDKASSIRSLIQAYTNDLKRVKGNGIMKHNGLAITRVVPRRITKDGREVQRLKKDGKYVWGRYYTGFGRQYRDGVFSTLKSHRKDAGPNDDFYWLSAFVYVSNGNIWVPYLAYSLYLKNLLANTHLANTLMTMENVPEHERVKFDFQHHLIPRDKVYITIGGSGHGANMNWRRYKNGGEIASDSAPDENRRHSVGMYENRDFDNALYELKLELRFNPNADRLFDISNKMHNVIALSASFSKATFQTVKQGPRGVPPNINDPSTYSKEGSGGHNYRYNAPFHSVDGPYVSVANLETTRAYSFDTVGFKGGRSSPQVDDGLYKVDIDVNNRMVWDRDRKNRVEAHTVIGHMCGRLHLGDRSKSSTTVTSVVGPINIEIRHGEGGYNYNPSPPSQGFI